MRAVAFALLLAAAPSPAAEYRYVAAGTGARATCASVADGWQLPAFDDASWAAATPLDPTLAPPPCATLHLRARFDTHAESSSLAALTLRLRYQDGFVAYLNGVEVARRRLAPAAPLADEPHSLEPESITVPVRPGLLRSSNNVIAVEVRPWRPTRRAAGELELFGSDGPRLVRGPYLQDMGTRDGWVVVDTDLPTEAELRLDGRVVHDGAATHHELHLTGLAAATAFHYEVSLRAPGAATAITTGSDFHTPPDAGRPLRFVVYGDVRSGHDVHATLVKAIAAEDPDLCVMTGDLVDRGDEGEWQRFFAIEAPLLAQVPVYPAIGNHEYGHMGSSLARFLGAWLRRGAPAARPPQLATVAAAGSGVASPAPAPVTWWSFDVAGVHFALLDSQAFDNPDQLAWLDHDLDEARRRGARALFVVDHDGPYSSELHGDNALAVRDVVPILERHHVAMAFSGHDHDYERGHVGNLDYVVTGGGGAELRPLRCGPGARRACGPRVKFIANEHNYVSVEVTRRAFRVCPRRPDGTALEECVRYPLPKL